MLSKILYWVTALIISAVASKRALLFFQQNRYEAKRYSAWLKKYFLAEVFDIVNPIFLVATIVLKLLKINKTVTIVVALIYALLLLVKEGGKEYIKNLVLTRRVKTQIAVLAVLIICYLLVFRHQAYALILLEYVIFVMIFLMHLITLPIERAIYNYYINDAKKVLSHNPNLVKIGITGSYGKTSVKHLVNHLLEAKYYSLMTPASFNTPMGICRIVRGELKNIHEVFVCEMGADKVGDIDELMDFIEPSISVVTSIGPQHLQTFKSLDNIIKEKMKAVEKLDKNGFAVINVDNEYIRDYQIKNPVKIIRVGIKNTSEADYYAYDIRSSIEGSSFTVHFPDGEEKLQSRLLGEHNVLNILLAIAIADQLGVSREMIKTQVSTLEYVEHRLQLRNINGFNFIDNAYNSNPVSSKLSIDTLASFDRKKIVVTPGFIDLGVEEDRYNYEFGQYMADKVDKIILVGRHQTEKIRQGLTDKGFEQDKILTVDKVAEAFDHIYRQENSEEVIVLLENDLPDAFNN
jgi:UDP-N-acetylmuramoyl-tripeptide--D-alanyl-D-alanine ligase